MTNRIEKRDFFTNQHLSQQRRNLKPFSCSQPGDRFVPLLFGGRLFGGRSEAESSRCRSASSSRTTSSTRPSPATASTSPSTTSSAPSSARRGSAASQTSTSTSPTSREDCLAQQLFIGLDENDKLIFIVREREGINFLQGDVHLLR